MGDADPEILVLERHIDAVELSRPVQRFEDMVKYVVDVRRGVIGIGGEMQADAEQVPLEHGSLQPDLWGTNDYPGRGEDGCIEFTSLINIRPAANNRSMEIQDQSLRDKVRELTFALIGRGEPL